MTKATEDAALSFLKDIPTGLDLPLLVDPESSVVELWKGDATVNSGQHHHAGNLTVCLQLQPSPRVRWAFEFSEDLVDSFFRCLAVEAPKTVEIESTGPFGKFCGHILKSSTGRLSGFFSTESDEPIPPNADRAVFLIVNGPHHDGKPIVRGHSSYLGRMTAAHKRVGITVDRLVHKIPADQIYSVTHVCEVRWKGKLSHKIYSQICRNLFRTLSLMATSWVGVAGPWYFEKGQLIGVSPRVTKATRLNNRSWALDRADEVFGHLFDRLMTLSLSKDVEHKEAWQTSFHWLIESEQCAGGLEGAMILQQAALEAAAWFEIVTRRKLCSEAGFEKLPAEDKLRWLCSLYSVPIEIPKRAKHLRELSKEMQRTDIVGVFTEVRNAYVHSSPRKLRKIRELNSPDGMRELWYQAGGILELLVLASLGYSGQTLRRDVDGQYPNEILRTVPW